MIKNIFTAGVLALSTGLLPLIQGCAVTPSVQYMKRTEPALADQTKAKQVNQGITISLKPLESREYSHPDFKQPVNVIRKGLGSDNFSKETLEFNYPIFRDMTAIEVTIINNTDHILRMRDSRVAFIDPDSDEPVMAYDKENMTEYLTELPSFKYSADYIKGSYPYTEDVNDQVEKALKNIIKKIKFINGFNKEIMPGMKQTGVIVFPISLEKAGEGKISFIDMAAKTDAAGNVTEKVRFDYIVQPLLKYFKMEQGKDADWVEIEESVYKAGGGK
ncbi:MAG: hypothetical protein J0L62_05185 [Bacteroidetes bacterium]|nr:hypothetical protein [Bacteroidota bacterium]